MKNEHTENNIIAITIMIVVVWFVGTAQCDEIDYNDYFYFYEYCEGIPWPHLLFENWLFDNPIITVDHGRWRTVGRMQPCYEVADVTCDGITNMKDFAAYAKHWKTIK